MLVRTARGWVCALPVPLLRTSAWGPSVRPRWRPPDPIPSPSNPRLPLQPMQAAPARLGSIRHSTTFNPSTEAPSSSGRLDSTPLLDCGMQAHRCRYRMLRRKAREALWSTG
ncbi:hypothetical protein DFH08DRAFT_847562 [Mycena albidolilacea]|uniref:Uncharacterized protein n=1 Tax=Mycena albidolilacea TaxID=1033008 RepID=A0AAD7AG74_9AGAR|nr:hypothetical protein DFH08DRAFT_847562 [Mycena albidolilacea]